MGCLTSGEILTYGHGKCNERTVNTGITRILCKIYAVGAIINRPAEGSPYSPETDANTKNRTARAIHNRPYDSSSESSTIMMRGFTDRVRNA